MATEAEFLATEHHKFNEYSEQCTSLKFEDNKEFKNKLNYILDQLNSLEFSLPIANKTSSILLLHALKLVPFNHELLFTKVCQLLVNCVSRQKIELSARENDVILDYLVRALQECKSWILPDILRAFCSLIYDDGAKAAKFYDILIGEKGILISLIYNYKEEDTLRGAVQCLQHICLKAPGTPYLDDGYIIHCLNAFLHILNTPIQHEEDASSYCKVLVNAIRGLQNIMTGNKTAHLDHIGDILGILKSYMFYGFPGIVFTSPRSIYPTPTSQHTPKVKEETSLRPEVGGAKSKKSKKTLKSPQNKAEHMGDTVPRNEIAAEAIKHLNIAEPDSMPTHGFRPSWQRTSSSESEYSDSEGAQASKVRSMKAKVRQCSLNCLALVFKVTSKKIMFGYWSCFIPDSSTPQSQTVFTSILKDPSPKVRTLALVVLSAMLDGSRQYLTAAEDSVATQTAFTSFSSTLGNMVKELHRGLLLALVAENSPLNIIQIIKCIAVLIINVPYQKLRPGLLTRLAKQVKPYLNHKDANIRVACLTCLGAMVTVQAPLLEVYHIFTSVKTTHVPSQETRSGESESESGYSSVCDSSAPLRDQSYDSTAPLREQPTASGSSTPSYSPGILTPNFQDIIASQTKELPWILRTCISFVLPGSWSNTLEPLPVRLEALQVLTQLIKGYFLMARNHLKTMTDVIQSCLSDRESDIQYHGAKLLDETAIVLLQQQQNSPASNTVHSAHVVEMSEINMFWNTLLSGPLPAALQHKGHALKATVCDCLSNIGAPAFTQLPPDKRILCITILLGSTNDEDIQVKAAAVRALGVYVLYPVLREDISFVADTANAVILNMSDANSFPRIKAAWSLANLGESLVQNKESSDCTLVEDFSDMLLIKLFQTAIKGCQDNDKVKSNTVRALGNFLRYIHHRNLDKSQFMTVIDQAIHSLVKSVTAGVMKVRWNACYAIGNSFKNDLLPFGKASWTVNVYQSLSSVVKDCKNFKVRINAATALAAPSQRHLYGQVSLYVGVWKSLILALINTETLTEFVEFKYSEQLVDQICSTILHLGSLLTTDDLPELGAILYDKADVLMSYMEKHTQKILLTDSLDATKVRLLTNCVDHISSVLQGKLSKDEESTAKILEMVFSQQPADTDSFGATAFRQIYD